jgi:hypothetical protein
MSGNAKAPPTWLSEDIVEAIIQGNHPPDLTAQTLITRRIELPLEW